MLRRALHRGQIGPAVPAATIHVSWRWTMPPRRPAAKSGVRRN